MLSPYFFSQSDLQLAFETLTQKKVEYVVYLALSPAAMQESCGIPQEEYQQRAEQERDFLLSDYELLEGGGSLRLYQRR